LSLGSFRTVNTRTGDVRKMLFEVIFERITIPLLIGMGYERCEGEQLGFGIGEQLR
jgi:hypothetical protein